MKTNFVRQCSVGLAAGLTFFLGCARPSAEPEQPKAVVAPPPVALIAPAVPAAPVAPQTAAVAPAPAAAVVPDTNAPAIIERIPASNKPENVPMSQGLTEVVKLAQAGVGEEVILAYIEKYSDRFSVGADQILYLNDLGVSSTVITSMLKHDGNTEPAVANASPPLVQTQAVSNVPQAPVVEQPAPQMVATAVAPPPTSPEVSYFYDTLSPYGSWIYLSGYGWCWQPTVAVSVPTWRPYCDRGRWYWSDSGWYWSSDYSWGWAPFHYGRWYRHPGSGWVWTPGTVWAPSWVSWRYSDGYCGWAPLPPEAHFVTGVGFSFHGSRVSIGFEFGLHDYHYSFVHLNNFCDYAPYRYVVPHTQVRNFYRNTTVINNYVVGNNNTIINRGVGRETIARSSQTRIREVSVREAPVRNLASVRGDRIEREGNQTVVYRPQLPKTPPAVRSAQFANRPSAQGQAPATVARNSGGSSQPAAVGRQQTGVAGRQIENKPVENNNPRASQPGRVAPENRNGREAVSPRGNAPANREQSAPRNTQPNANPAPNRQPRSNNAPLFGPSTGSAAPQQNNAVARTAEPQNNSSSATRAVPQNVNPSAGTRVAPQNNTATATRAVPQNRQNNTPAAATPPARAYQAPAATQQPQVYAAPRSNPGRSVQDHQAMSPRQYEQTSPRYTAPAPQNPQPAARAYEAPRATTESSRPAASGGGRAASRSESAPSRAERAERNR